LEIDVRKREVRESRIDRPKYQWNAYRLLSRQKQDGVEKATIAAAPNGRLNRVKALPNWEDRTAFCR
jgi:hypothetical protein